MVSPFPDTTSAKLIIFIYEFPIILKYALKVDFWDVDAMSDAIYGLLQYPAIAQLAARCGYDEVNSIKWNDVAAKIKGIYQEVIDKN